MGRDAFPRPDTAAANFMRGFASMLVAAPGDYHVQPAQAAEVMAAVTAFRSALAVVRVPGTRTSPAIQTKDTARAAAEAICRRYYALVRNNPEIDDTTKLRAGVRPPKARRKRSGAPTTFPQLIVTAVHGVHRIRWYDVSTPHRKAKPAGCAMLQLFVAAPGEGLPMDRARLVNVYTTTEVTLAPAQIAPLSPREASAAPTAVTLLARWAGPRGQPGPWSPPKLVRLAA